MPRPIIGARPLTKTERQRRWREGKRLAQAAEPEPALARSPLKPDPIVAAGTGYGEYAGIVRQALAAVDALPQPHIALLEVVQRLQREYLDRR
jgi:hypothetical protein